MNFKTIIALFFLLFCFTTSVYSQENIEETKKIADKLFEEEEYIKATPYYLRLLAGEPRDHNLNFHYGACLLHDLGQKQDVFKYLNYAVMSETVDPEANYFLAKAYHLNYQFSDAIKYYKIYQTKAGSKIKQSFDVQRQIEMCENGKKLITTITEMKVLDKKEIEKSKFFRLYDLSDIGGNILVTADFQTKLDKQKEHVPLIYFPQNPSVIYYSSYGENGKTGKDIYVQRRLPTGGWGEPQLLKGDVNTKYDEDYPYMNPKGDYLYFSSKGHNSMGGYDVFRCKYDAETDMFGKAENMDFAVSSPMDDLFYVVDSLDKNAYFASNRQSSEGNLNYYKVRVDRVPLNLTVVKGEFSSLINPQMKKVLIDVKDFASGEFIGNFNSNEKGVYLITFPKGGKYELTIKVGENAQEYKYLTSIPFQKEFKPLKQKIVHEQQGDRENVKVIDLFNEAVEDPQGVFAQVIKMKSELVPNVSAEELARLEKETKDKEILKELGLGKLSLVEVGYLLEDEVKDAKKAEGGTKDLENKLYEQVLENTTEIKRLDGLISDKIEKANAAPTDKRKYKLLKEAERALKIQEELKELSDKSLKIADSLSKTPNKGSAEKTAEVARYSEHFNELIKENKQAEAYAYLSDNKDAIKKLLDEKALDPLQELIDRGLMLDEEIARLQPKEEQFDRDMKKIDSDIAEMERAKNGAKKKEIEDLETAIKNKKTERTLIFEERNFNLNVLNEKINERSAIRRQVDLLEGIVQTKVDRVISKEEVELALKSSNTTNSTEVRSKIQSQISQLVLTDPSVQEVDYADLETDLGPVAANSKSRAEKIKNDATLSAEEKANKLKALDREFLASVDNEILATEKLAKQNPSDPQVKKKLDALKTAKSLVSTSLERDSKVENVVAAQPNSTSGSAEVEQHDISNPPAPVESNENTEKATVNSEVVENKGVGSKVVAGEEVGSNNLSNEKIDNGNDSPIKTDSQETKLQEQSKSLENANKEQVKEVEVEVESSKVLASNKLDTKAKETLIESVNASYNEKLNAINSNSTATNSEKLSQIQSLDKELVSSINEVVNSLEISLKQNPANASLAKKIADLKLLEAEIQTKITEREAQLVSNSSSTEDSNSALSSENNNSSSKDLTQTKNSETPSNSTTSTAKKVELIETVSPSYNENVSAIQKNASLTEKEKKEALQKLDEQLLVSVEKEIAQVESQLATDPSDILLKNRLVELEKIESELKSAISVRSNDLATNAAKESTSIPAESSTGTSSSNSSLNKSELIEAVNPSYDKNVSAIQNNTALTEKEKLKEQQLVDQQLLSAVEKEIKNVNALLSKNPSDALSKSKLIELEKIKAELVSKMSERESVISTAQEGSTVSTTKLDFKAKENVIESVNSSYNENVAKVNSNNSLSEKEKLQQLQQLDKALLNSLKNELSVVENQLKQNPKDVTLINKESSLIAVKNEIESVVNSRESVLSASSQSLTSKEKSDLINGLSPMYSMKINEINKNTSLSESEKIAQLQKADQELIALIDKEIVALENNSKNNPDPQLMKELSDLKTVKAELVTSISARENGSNVVSTTNEATSSTKSKSIEIAPLSRNEKSAVIKSVSPTYNDDLAQIMANTSLNETEKTAQLQQLDKSLLNSIEKELSRVESDLKANPSDPILLKKEANLASLKAEVEKAIEDREANKLITKTPVDKKMKHNVIRSADTKYEQAVEAIYNNKELTVLEKLNKLQELDYKIVADLDKELKTFKIDLKYEPGDTELVTIIKEITAVKAEIEEDISERESVIASSNFVLDETEKSNLIRSIDPKYLNKVAEINSNEYLLETEKLVKLQELEKELDAKLKKEIEVLEKTLAENPLNISAKRKLEGLNVVKSEVESKIIDQAKILSPSENSNALTSKSKLIETFNPGYTKKVNEIKNNALSSQLEKLEALQKLDKELLQSVEIELNKASEELTKNPKDESLKATKNDLLQLKLQAESIVSDRVKAIENEKMNLVNESQKEELISELNPNYTLKLNEIKSSKVEKAEQLQAYISEEKALLNLVEQKFKEVEDQLNQNPTNQELQKKVTLLTAVKKDSRAKLDDLTKQAITLKVQNIDQQALITKVDGTFDADVKELKLSVSPTKLNDLASREEKLQQNIQNQVAKNDQANAANYSLDLAAENQILKQKIKESKTRELGYLANNLRTELLGNSAEEIGKNYVELADLKNQQKTVESYINALNKQTDQVESELTASPQNSLLLDKKELLHSELNVAEEKLEKITNKVDDLEGKSVLSSLTTPELKKLIDKELTLNEQLENPKLTKKEKSALEKELESVQREKSVISNKLISDNLVVRKADNEQKTRQLKQSADVSEISKITADLAGSQNSRLTEESASLIAKSEKTKNPVAKNELLVQAIEKQAKADEIIQSALEENVTREVIQNQVETLDSKEDLEHKKRKFSIEIGEITKEADELEAQYVLMKAKKAAPLVKKRENLLVEKSLLEKELEEVEKQIAAIPPTPKTVDSKAIEQPVSFSEEKQLIASKEYLEYSINAKKALRIESQISENEQILKEKQKAAKELIAMSLDKKSNITNEDVKQGIQNVKIVEEEIKSLKAELIEKQNITKDLLAKNDTNALRMQNLMQRGVEPEFNETLALIEQQRAPAEGLKYSMEPINTYSDANPIPINVKNPAGLVYRIQVGAFSKPIPQDMYQSFSPVSGEKLASGVTRYMAGYFNNTPTVNTAFSQVKALGYSDAFIVAYCDEERIPLAEARKLEATGQCISTESIEFKIAMSKMSGSSGKQVSDLTYNEAPGAAKAIAAESKLGLFFTVQVGVYNKPATASQLKNMNPLVTQRMPNGQIRYSSGMFSSIEAAKPKKSEAIGKGIHDAFIAAYYKGERITLSQASALLKQNGDGILEKIDQELLASFGAEMSNKKVEEVSAYNKAPGAVPAKAAEAHLGLFFTVQIGVYSKPASSKQLNFVTPLITKKLENGQIRYSTGMFRSIEDADIKRKETLGKGVKHAYITAYFKGERITIAEAKALLATNGEAILEKLGK